MKKLEIKYFSAAPIWSGLNIEEIDIVELESGEIETMRSVWSQCPNLKSA